MGKSGSVSVAPAASSLTLIVLLIVGCSAGIAQTRQAESSNSSKIERKNRAPVSKGILRVKLPRPVETILDNGLTVMVLEDQRAPLVSVQLQIAGAGPIHEAESLAGVAVMTAQMLREGTGSRSSKQIAEEIEKLGASFLAVSQFGSTTANISASGLSDNFDDWFALTLDMVLNPSFPAAEIDKLKKTLGIQLQTSRTSPDFLATERLTKALFGTHPAARLSATEESLGRINSQELKKWHRERYAPQNSILGIAGAVSAPQVIANVKKWLAGWPRNNYKAVLPAEPTPLSARRIHLVDRPGSVQTNIALANLTIDRAHPDYIPLVVMNRVVGEGPAARLFMNLREQKGYTYSTNSSLVAAQYSGQWQAKADTRVETTENTLAELLNEIRRIRDEKVNESELEERKRSVAAAFALSLETPAQVLGYAIARKTYGFGNDYWDTYPAKIMAVTADEVQLAARKYLNLDTIQIVAVGDAAKIRDVLAKFGPVAVYDSQGNLRNAAGSAPVVR